LAGADYTWSKKIGKQRAQAAHVPNHGNFIDTRQQKCYTPACQTLQPISIVLVAPSSQTSQTDRAPPVVFFAKIE
jgi:hypothetical protein